MRELILGLIQGITEFLPISSSGHLVVGQHLFPGNQGIDQDVLFDILLHFATLLVVLIYYRQEIVTLLKSLLSFVRHPGLPSEPQEQYSRKMWLLLIVGSIPTGLIGVGIKMSHLDEDLFSSLPLVGIALVITGILLYFSDTLTLPASRAEISYVDALIIGIVQGIAVLPGISRSGSTISAGILRGLERNIAAKFSFLLSIPAILGAVVIEAKDLSTLVSAPQLIPYGLGMLVAFVSGYVAIRTLILLVIKRQLRWFAFYCWTIGGIVLVYSVI